MNNTSDKLFYQKKDNGQEIVTNFIFHDHYGTVLVPITLAITVTIDMSNCIISLRTE